MVDMVDMSVCPWLCAGVSVCSFLSVLRAQRMLRSVRWPRSTLVCGPWPLSIKARLGTVLPTNTFVRALGRTMAGRVEITIPPADDFHHHFRDGEVLKDTVQHACRMFRRAVRKKRQENSEVVTARILSAVFSEPHPP